MKNNYKSLTKAQLLKRLEIVEQDNERLERRLEESYNEDDLSNRYDDGYDEGYREGQRDNRCELSERELRAYGDNIIRLEA